MYCAYSTLKINITFSYYCVFFNEFGPWCVIFLVWFVSSLFCHLAFYLPFSLSVSLSLFILRYYSHQGRTSLLSEWQSTGTGCLEVLWSLVLWRYSWPAWMPTYVTCYKEPALASWIQWSLEVPSNPYSSVILWSQYFQMETELAKPAGELWNKWNTVAVVDLKLHIIHTLTDHFLQSRGQIHAWHNSIVLTVVERLYWVALWTKVL